MSGVHHCVQVLRCAKPAKVRTEYRPTTKAINKMHRSAAYEGIPPVSATSRHGTEKTLQTAAMITTSPSPKLACTQDQSNDDDIARPERPKTAMMTTLRRPKACQRLSVEAQRIAHNQLR